MESESTSTEHRLVHLDLKGAPPKISYYDWLFPMLHKWGATGLLVEYEDMFPYSGDLATLAAPNAYSMAEVEQLQLVAKNNDLIVIPLIQTFGHFEFVLKHDRFRHLREVPNCPMTVCSLHPGSLKVITEMIDQVMSAHPDASWFHIGADEVFHVGLCETCELFMREHSLLPVDLFTAHIRRVLEHVRSRHPGVQAIMWDDMFRGIDLHVLQASGIGGLVQPMVWYYQTTFSLPADIWSRYVSVFGGLWAASAFKGATGPCAVVTDIGYHTENHKQWMNVVSSDIRPLTDKFHGYALTGWQRYDHYSVLCELLPVGLPSLAVCLRILSSGAFTREVHVAASKDLNFDELIPLNPLNYIETANSLHCEFVGHEVFTGVHKLLRLKAEYKFFIKNDRLKGWMTDWHVRHNFTNPVHLNHFLPHGQRLLESCMELKAELQSAMTTIFYADTVDEWLSVNIDPVISKLIRIVNTAGQQIQLSAGVKTTASVSATVDNPCSAGSKQ